MYIKRFKEWFAVKERINDEIRGHVIAVGEVRWCSIGVNVGEEIDGKGDEFLRPVLVIDTVGSRTALVVPLSTKIKKTVGYMLIHFNNKDQSLVISNIRVVSQKRLLRRIGKLPGNRLKEIKEEIKKFYHL